MRLIDADALFKYLPLKICVPCPFGEEKECRDCVVDKVMQRIEDAPTIAAPRWVRREEPPKKDGKYLVCWKDSGGFCWDSAWWNDGAWSLTHWIGVVPTHWMPIEPPKEGV